GGSPRISAKKRAASSLSRTRTMWWFSSTDMATPRWIGASGAADDAVAANVAGTSEIGGLMVLPVMLLADGSQAGGLVEAELRKRYEADYRVIATASAREALELLGELRDSGSQVCLVLADQWLPGATGRRCWRGAGSFIQPPGGR